MKKIANYNLIEEIGSGAFGKVYLASKNNNQYAVKIIKIEDNDNYDKYCNEIEILSRIDHPNIINYIEAFKKGRSLVIIMEYVNGLNLTQYMDALRQRVRITLNSHFILRGFSCQEIRLYRSHWTCFRP
jgi:serine/threonine protein kinase